jgi:hypothetical protein
MSPSDVELVSAIVYNVCDRHGRTNSAPFWQFGILELFWQFGILELFWQFGILELFWQFSILELFWQFGILELFRQLETVKTVLKY